MTRRPAGASVAPARLCLTVPRKTRGQKLQSDDLRVDVVTSDDPADLLKSARATLVFVRDSRRRRFVRPTPSRAPVSRDTHARSLRGRPGTDRRACPASSSSAPASAAWGARTRSPTPWRRMRHEASFWSTPRTGSPSGARGRTAWCGRVETAQTMAAEGRRAAAPRRGPEAKHHRAERRHREAHGDPERRARSVPSDALVLSPGIVGDASGIPGLGRVCGHARARPPGEAEARHPEDRRGGETRRRGGKRRARRTPTTRGRRRATDGVAARDSRREETDARRDRRGGPV